jgi:thiamine biosynthesis lipoprotein
MWKRVSRARHWRGLCASQLALLSLLVSACSRQTAGEAQKMRDVARVNSAVSRAFAEGPPSPLAPEQPIGDASHGPDEVDFQDEAMGTNVRFVAFTNDRVDVAQVRSAMSAAFDEIKRLEALLSEWRNDSEVGQINLNPAQWVRVGPETFAVIARGLAAGAASQGAFDITFQAMSDVWKFGSAAEAEPKLPVKAEVEQRRRFVDFRKVEIDARTRAVRIPQGFKLGLGGIAKGYIVDRAADILKKAAIQAFLVQAGGDLYGAGRKPDGSPWVTGIQDPRAPQGEFFATIELTDHAFSTAGDYARSYVISGRRYHHIIDPHTGYPATASRSVTVWADDATTADAIDDAVFILGPERGLALVQDSPGVGVVIVDKNNKVWLSPRLSGKVHVTRQPTDGI